MNRKVLTALVVLAGFVSMFGGSVAHAQGSALEHMGSADTRRAISPRDQALGFLSRAQRQIAKAEKLAAEAAALPPGSKAGEKAKTAYERATKELSKALAKDTELREAHLLAGQCWLALSEPAKAQTACHQAWALDPSRGDAPLCEARAALAQAKVRRAQEVFLALKEKSLTDATTLLDEMASWLTGREGDPSLAPVATWIDQQRAALPGGSP